MILKLTGERPVFAAVNKTNETHFFIPWEVSAHQPIGAAEHIASLKEVLGRSFLDDIVFFHLDMQTAQPLPEVIDPSLSCYDQKLEDGTFVFVSINPTSILNVEEVVVASSATCGDPSENPYVLPWTPFPSSSLRFGDVGENIRLLGKHSRCVCKPFSTHRSGGGGGGSTAAGDDDPHQSHGGNSWSKCVALGSTALDNDGIRSFSVCIRWDPNFVKAATEDHHQQQQGEAGGDMQLGGYADEDDTTTTATMESTGGRSRATSLATTATTAGKLNATAALAQAMAHRQQFDPEAELCCCEGGGGGEADNNDAGGSTETSRRKLLHCVPHVAVGVADSDISLDDDVKQHSSYNAAFMLDVATGCFYTGGAKRPLYVDAHTYRCHEGMILTFVLDTSTGVLNVVQKGKVVLVCQIPSMLADVLHPCVELYSEGGIVDLI